VKLTPWWQRFFGEAYLQALGFPGAEQTALECDAIEHLLELRPGERLLDLGCGIGRHAIEFGRRGYAAVGIDHSAPFLRHARAAATENNLQVPFVRGDLRAIPFRACFDAMYCVFATFGICDGPPTSTAARLAQPQALLHGAAQALRPGGRFLVDGAHSTALAGTPPQQAWHRRGGARTYELWSFVSMIPVIRTVKEFTGVPGTPAQSVERHVTYLAAFDAAEIQRLFQQAGFQSVHLFGGYDDRHPLDAQAGWFVAVAHR
jgi:SAM-dependent methyltransferase